MVGSFLARPHSQPRGSLRECLQIGSGVGVWLRKGKWHTKPSMTARQRTLGSFGTRSFESKEKEARVGWALEKRSTYPDSLSFPQAHEDP